MNLQMVDEASLRSSLTKMSFNQFINCSTNSRRTTSCTQCIPSQESPKSKYYVAVSFLRRSIEDVIFRWLARFFALQSDIASPLNYTKSVCDKRQGIRPRSGALDSSSTTWRVMPRVQFPGTLGMHFLYMKNACSRWEKRPYYHNCSIHVISTTRLGTYCCDWHAIVCLDFHSSSLKEK